MITPPAKAPRQKRVSFAVLLLFILLGWWFFFVYQRPVSAPEIAPIPVTARGDLAADEQSTIALFRSASPAVVYITSIEVRRNIFSLNIHEIPQGTGSGFIWDKQGRVVTNYHVIEAASRVEVTLADRSTWQATLVGVAPDKDLAVLQISAPAEKLTPLPLGESNNLLVGQKVFAIGNPFGLDRTMTVGVISATGRSNMGIETYENFIQTDASINPGNSGGPLLNVYGEVIGINTAIVAAGQGIGFAIPVNMAKPIFSQLIKKGSVSRGWMGVTIQPVTEELAKSFGLRQAKGALVNDVMKGSPSEKAGIRQGDVITAFNGTEVKDPSHLQRLVAESAVGKPARVTVFRDGKSIDLSLSLVNAETAPKVQRSGGGEQQGQSDPIGLVVDDADQGAGVIVMDVARGSAAAEAGIRRGDVIVSINRKKITNSADYQRMIKQSGRGSGLAILVRRGDANIYFALRLQ